MKTRLIGLLLVTCVLLTGLWIGSILWAGSSISRVHFRDTAILELKVSVGGYSTYRSFKIDKAAISQFLSRSPYVSCDAADSRCSEWLSPNDDSHPGTPAGILKRMNRENLQCSYYERRIVIVTCLDESSGFGEIYVSRT